MRAKITVSKNEPSWGNFNRNWCIWCNFNFGHSNFLTDKLAIVRRHNFGLTFRVAHVRVFLKSVKVVWIGQEFFQDTGFLKSLKELVGALRIGVTLEILGLVKIEIDNVLVNAL